MNLLKQITNKQKQRFSIVRENDATGAGDVAGVFAPLMGANTMIKRLNDATIKKSVKKKTKRVNEQIGVADDFADFEQWVGACRKAGGATFKSVNPENHDDGVRCYMVTNGKTIDVGYWADGHGEVTRYTAESKKLGLLGAYKDIVSEGALPGYKKWKAEMTAAGAVKFWRDQHGGGAVDHIVAHDKDGKAVGGFNRKAAVREGVIAEGGESEFDQSSVISKLKALEDKEKADVRDTVTFGIEDENNQVVRVTIRAEQAGEFEKALQAVMADMEEDENSKIEIAEVLFKLKDNFDIVDVVWPEIEEDEEVPRQQFGDEQGEPGAEGDGLEGLEGEGGEGDPLADLEDDGAGEESEVKGLLSQVIDMMKADAAARQADAEARIADAKAREQELGAKQALAKIKQEEQFLDMEEYEKKQKAQEKEAKRLAQLARWKSQMGSSGMTDAIADDGPEMGLPPRRGPVGMPGGEENEEIHRAPTRVAAGDLARKLMGRR